MKAEHITLLKYTGECCRNFRKSKGYLQSEVAADLNVSEKLVSAFECGKQNNAVVLLWYFAHGMNPVDIFSYISMNERINNGK